MKFCYSIVLYLVAFFALSVKAQINTQIPKWVNLIDIKNIGSVNKNQIKDGYYYLLLDEQFNEITHQRYIHFAKSALTEEALTQVSQVELSYNPSYEKATIHAIRVHRGNQVIDKIKDIEIKTLNEESQRNRGLLTGNKTLYANLSDVRKGDIVEFCYSYTGKNPIMADYFNYNLYFTYSVPIGKIYSRILFPKATSPNIVYKNTTITPTIIQTDLNDYTWEVNNPTVLTLESFVPQWYDPYGAVQISNLKSWQEVKKHCQTFFNLSTYDNSGLKTIVDSIVNSTSHKHNQITAIIEFVQTHIRYSGDERGIYSHIPRSPDRVLKNRYGDCKEKSVLLKEMLKLIDIEAYPVLVNTSLGNTLVDHVPSISIFDHCISVFIYKNRLHFIDPTISYQRGNFESRIIPPYKSGMILDGKKEPFTNIPVDEITSKSKIWEDFTISTSGDAKLRATSVYTGTLADEARYFFLTNSLDDIQESYKQFYTRYAEEIDVIDSITYTDNAKKNEFTINETYLLKNFWAITDSSQSKVITKDFAPYSLILKLNFGSESKRRDPLSVPYPLNYSHTITVFKKEGWKVQDSKETDDNQFFRYNYTTKVKGDATLELIYDFASKTEVITPEYYPEYKSKMDYINTHIIFSAQENPLSNGTIGFNWALILTVITGTIFTFIIIRHLYVRPVESEYLNRHSTIGGWLILVAIGITFSPLRIFIEMIVQIKDEIGINYAVYYFDVNSPFFSPMQGYFSLIVTFINTFLLGLSILVAVLFYQRKAAFRNVYTFYVLFSFAFLLTNLIILNHYYGDSSNAEERALLSKETNAIVRIFIHACIWIPYIWISERSKHTFTKSNTTDENIPLSTNPEPIVVPIVAETDDNSLRTGNEL